MVKEGDGLCSDCRTIAKYAKGYKKEDSLRTAASKRSKTRRKNKK